MKDLSKAIQQAVTKLFKEDKVDLVIGFAEGSIPLRTTPCFVQSAEAARKLVWNSCCENNLAAYLPKKQGRVGIVVKGCDSRSLVGLLKEKQVERKDIVIIGVPCQGMIDRKKTEETLSGRKLKKVSEKQETLVLSDGELEKEVRKDDFLQENCATCVHRNPVLYDILIADPVEEQHEVDEFEGIRAFEAKSSNQRWDYFTQEIKKCIRCYACRNACPLCYCEECCVDATQPQWFGKSVDVSDTQVFHLMRALHLTGRCVDCGACVRACPMDVDLRFLNKKIEKDVRELFSFETGIDLEEPSPLATFKPDDPQEFIT